MITITEPHVLESRHGTDSVICPTLAAAHAVGQRPYDVSLRFALFLGERDSRDEISLVILSFKDLDMSKYKGPSLINLKGTEVNQTGSPERPLVLSTD